jgi:hypothetical protein
MARTNAVNFSGALQFPMANAATDLFKKEDVQTLALAVDGHDHSSGKGLVLPASAIPLITSAMIQDGTITSADIADGTIQTVDLAAGATYAYGTVTLGSQPTTTSATLVDLPGMSVTLSFSSGLTVALLNVSMNNSVSGNGCYLALNLDSSDGAPILMNSISGGFGISTVLGTWGLSGTHTIKGRFSSPNGGTVTATPGGSILLVVEFKR